jgi:ABC-2 type transport system permease protein
MIPTILRRTGMYTAIGSMVAKEYLTYRVWFWVGFFLRAIAMAIYVFFWRAVYADTNTISGLNLQQTLNYILLAQVFSPLLDMFLVFEFGYNLREGAMAIALLRPISLQGTYYAMSFSRLIVGMVSQMPMVLIATFVFGLQWPSDPAIWAAFVVTVILGRTVLFFFDWILACLTFYTTEVWGLGVLIEGISLFFSGGLIPLVMMPGWLQTITQSFPFAQALYVPLSILTGIVPLSQVPQLWLVQLIWLVCLGTLAKVFFSFAIRKVTVQGG